MKVAIDISARTHSGNAIGNVNGLMEFDVIPQVGDTISFVFPKPAGLAPVKGFVGLLQVRARQLSAIDGPEATKVLLLLEDIVMSTADEVLAVAKFLDDGFGLGFDKYD